MTSYLLADLRTGRRLQTVPVMAGPWSTKIGQPDDISATIDMRNPDAIALDLRNSAAKARTILAVQEGANITAAGPIWGHKYDRDKGTLQLTAKGIRSVFNYRYILPIIAATTSLTNWLVPDPTDSSKTTPNTALQTHYQDVSYATMAKRLIQQAFAWTGGALPIDFSAVPDEVATGLTQTWDGVDLKALGSALDSLSGLQNGPELEFRPQFTSDGLGITFVAQFGTMGQPLATTGSRPRWSVTAPDSAVSALVVDGDGSALASNSWAAGGRTSDTVLISRAIDSTLVDQGYPLMEVADTTHSSVSLQPTLDAYAQQNLIDGQQSLETWSFQAESYPRDAVGNQNGPFVGSYRTGDYADLFVDGYDPGRTVVKDGQTIQVGAKGDPYLRTPKGGQVYTHRILGLAGDEKGQTVKVSLAPQGATS